MHIAKVLPCLLPSLLQMFHRATKHPNATVVSWSSPRVVLIRDFLAPDEIEHMVQQATGAVQGQWMCCGSCMRCPAACAALLLQLQPSPPASPCMCEPCMCAGGFERSEVVTDGEKKDSARTSFGSWLSGHKRSVKVQGPGGRGCVHSWAFPCSIVWVMRTSAWLSRCWPGWLAGCVWRQARPAHNPCAPPPFPGAGDPVPHPPAGGHPRGIWGVAVRASVRAGPGNQAWWRWGEAGACNWLGSVWSCISRKLHKSCTWPLQHAVKKPQQQHYCQ